MSGAKPGSGCPGVQQPCVDSVLPRRAGPPPRTAGAVRPRGLGWVGDGPYRKVGAKGTRPAGLRPGGVRGCWPDSFYTRTVSNGSPAFTNWAVRCLADDHGPAAAGQLCGPWVACRETPRTCLPAHPTDLRTPSPVNGCVGSDM